MTPAPRPGYPGQEAMIRELLDLALLEDFARGLARVSGLRMCVYGTHGGLVTASPPASEFSRLTGWIPGTIPSGLTLVPVPAHDPPGTVAFFTDRGIWYVAAPVYVDDQAAGWVVAGEFREQSLSGEQWQTAAGSAETDLPRVIQAWEQLPLLDRRGHAHAIITARWGARLLAEWAARESQLLAAAEETALIGDIAELLTGQQDLQTALNRIVAETAQALRCGFCSLRLYDASTNELTIRAVHNLSERYLNKGAILRLENSIDDQALRGQLVYVANAATDPRIQYPDQMHAEGIVSFLTAGLLYRGKPIGVLRVYTDRPRRFRRTQRTLLRAVAHQAAMAIVNARMVEQRLRDAQTERQLTLAGKVQARMMRIPAPRHAGLATASIFHPTSHLGGDFCDEFDLCDGRPAAVVADVVGKGIPASILSASIRGALRATIDNCGDTGAILTRLNRQVCRETTTSEFVTLLLVAINVQRQTLGYCNAGHEPLLLLRDGQVQQHPGKGIVLGVFPDEEYAEQKLLLQPGDFLLLYTDGAVDAANFTGELFGRPRLAQALRQYGNLAEVDQVLRNILWDIRRFAGLAEQADDITMIGLRILP
ncbi:MAG: SpoIIE family protein phosphatase [Phycisphaerae bacterium]|jgi:sigma-B regulation protein RsbU (phosphoserine phosphatase)